jgi:hypothetical protein
MITHHSDLPKALRVLHSDLHRAHAECHSINLTPVVKTVDSRRNLPRPNNSDDSDFFPDEIRDHIMNEPGVAVAYNFLAGGRKVVLHFVEFNQQPNQLDLLQMQAHARRVCALLHLVSLHANRNTCSSNISIYIYLTDFEKRFPTQQGLPLDAEHANTGMSYHCVRTNDVIVYRREEWFKVLIHELFHAFGLSFIESDMPRGVDAAMQAMLQKMYAISHPVRIYETYCEIWARILTVLFDCFADDDGIQSSNNLKGTGTNNSNAITELQFQVFMDCAMEGLEANARFARQQCAKLLRYADLSYAILATPTEENRAIVAEKYRENTNVFAYYFLTCVLLHSPDEFIGWCYKNNPCTKTSKNILQFRTAVLSNFNGLMELLHHCKQRCPALDSGSNVADVADIADVLGSSMRMTVTGQ